MKNTHAHRWILALPVLGLALAADLAIAGDSAQFSPTCEQVLVNKKVGLNEQWAITLSVSSQDVLGNVFKLDGSPASFVSCQYLGAEGDMAVYDCIGAEGCVYEGELCGGGQWTSIGTGIQVPLTFFLPEGVPNLEEPEEYCAEFEG